MAIDQALEDMRDGRHRPVADVFAAMRTTLAELPAAHPRAPKSPGTRGEEIRQLFYGDKPHAYRILFTINAPCRRCSC